MPWLLHVHGALMTSWFAFFFVQTTLIWHFMATPAWTHFALWMVGGSRAPPLPASESALDGVNGSVPGRSQSGQHGRHREPRSRSASARHCLSRHSSGSADRRMRTRLSSTTRRHRAT